MTFSALDSTLTGPLFATRAMREVFSDAARLRAMLRMEGALARAQARLGLVPEALALAIEAVAPEDLDAADIGARTAAAGVPTIPFLKALECRLPRDLAPHLHKGATTQDVVDTALVLQARDALLLIEADLDAVLAGLSALAERQRETPCAGRTYLQHAAPVSFGFKAAVWLTGLADVAAALPDLRRRALAASLGGPVGTLAGARGQGPDLVEAFAAELGLAAPPLAWHSLRGRGLEIGAWLAGVLGALAKLATDIAHLASTEVGEVAEPYQPGRGGSSAMPHKRNPVSATVILSAHAAAAGPLATLALSMAAAHERPAGAWHAEWHALPTLFGLASGALREGRALAEGLEVDADRMRLNLDLTRGLLFADAVAARLAGPLGSREAAHARVEAAAGVVRRTGQPLREVLGAELGDVDLAPAFDLAPALAACQPWIDRALAHARGVRQTLTAPS